MSTGPRADPYAWTFTRGGRWLVSTNYLVVPGLLQGFGDSSGLVVWRPGAPAATATSIPLGGPVTALTSCGADTVCVLRDGELRRVGLPDGPAGSPVTVGAVTGHMLSSPDGRLVALGRDGLIELRDSRTGALRRRLTGATGSPSPLAFSPDGSRLAAHDVAGTVLVWDLTRGGLPETLRQAGDDAAAWTPDGRSLVTRASGVLVWDFSGRRELGRVLTTTLPGDGSFDTHNNTTWGAKDTVVVAGRNGWLAFLDSRTGAMTTPRSPHHTPIGTARTGRGGTPLVTADDAGVTAVWDVPSRAMLGLVRGLPRPSAGHLADAWVSPDGRTGATLRSSRITLFDVARRTAVRQLPPLPHDRLFSLSYVDGWSGDGRRIEVIRRRADGSATEILLVDAHTGRVTLRIVGPSTYESAVDPKGRYLAVGYDNGTLRFYSQTDGHLLAPPQPATGGPIFNVSASPDGRYVTASGGAVATVAVFDTATYRRTGLNLPVTLPGDDLVTRTRFALDDSVIVVERREVQLFPLKPASLMARACRLAGRNLSRDEWAEVLPTRRYEKTCP